MSLYSIAFLNSSVTIQYQYLPSFFRGEFNMNRSYNDILKDLWLLPSEGQDV